jgi:putative ABC transport system permease protein
MQPNREILRLAYRDFVHERRISLCFVLALMAVLAPLLLLFGLKFGLVDTLAQRLIQSPANREVLAVGSHQFDEAWFERIGARSDVAFLVPSTRRIAASLSRVLSPASGRELRALQMIPTGAGDPLLDDRIDVPTGRSEVVLSGSAARQLAVQPGETLVARIDRQRDGRDESAVWELTVTGIVPRWSRWSCCSRPRTTGMGPPCRRPGGTAIRHRSARAATRDSDSTRTASTRSPGSSGI